MIECYCSLVTTWQRSCQRFHGYPVASTERWRLIWEL